MEASSSPGGSTTLTRSEAEAVVLHEVLAYSEWSSELESIEVKDDAEREVLERLQQALMSFIPDLGSSKYGATVRSARTAL